MLEGAQFSEEAAVRRLWKEIGEENKEIESSIKKLLRVVLKKARKEEKVSEALLGFLNLDFTVPSGKVTKALLKDYLDSLVEALEQYPELQAHLIEVVDAYLIVRGRGFDREGRRKAEKFQKHAKEHFRAIMEQVLPLLR